MSSIRHQRPAVLGGAHRIRSAARFPDRESGGRVLRAVREPVEPFEHHVIVVLVRDYFKNLENLT